MFIGRLSYALAVDPKGRLVIPQKVRDEIDKRDGDLEVMFGVFGAPCLKLYTKTQFELITRALEEALDDSLENDRKKRLFYSAFVEVSIDKQGRVTIPATLMRRAGVTSQVVVIGTKDRVEFWDEKSFEAYEQQAGNADDATTVEILGRARRALAAQGTKENG